LADLRIGLVTYTNLTSGIGVFGWEFFKHLEADSILSVASRKKGQEVWTERQVTAPRPPSDKHIDDYFRRFHPQVVLFLETPFSISLYSIARKYGAKTVGISMHETYSAYRLAADLVVCPCRSAWEKARVPNKRHVFLPIGLDLFEYKERQGHTFVMNIGYGWRVDRRQSKVVIDAFTQLEDPDARLILHAQECWPEGIVSKDPRIEYRLGGSPTPADNYAEGDILLAPMAYEGYGRTVLEGMASGMPVLTTDADPMNLFQHDPDLLIEPCERFFWTGGYVKDALFNRVSVEDMRRKLEWLLTIDTAAYSQRARRQAEAQSWESTKIDYKGLWLETLRSIL